MNEFFPVEQYPKNGRMDNRYERKIRARNKIYYTVMYDFYF